MQAVARNNSIPQLSPEVHAGTLTLRTGRCGSMGPRLPARREAALEGPGCLATPLAAFLELAGWPAMAADAS